jgi:DNA replication and repair protein RecF
MWLEALEVKNLRKIQHTSLELGPGLNVFAGANAQGKTSLLEAVAVLARGRSFRTDEVQTLIQAGSAGFLARGTAIGERSRVVLEVEVSREGRRLRLDGREVAPGAYHGRLEAVVYSTERLRIIRGSMRERRQFLDRGAAALRPAYRQALRDYDRVLAQRNAALLRGSPDLATWNQQFLELGAALRCRRAAYVEQLRAALRSPFAPAGEVYDVRLTADLLDEPSARQALEQEIRVRSGDERHAGRSLVGPHRDPVSLQVGGQEAAEGASSGQVRSLLLALCLAMLEVYRAETGEARGGAARRPGLRARRRPSGRAVPGSFAPRPGAGHHRASGVGAADRRAGKDLSGPGRTGERGLTTQARRRETA